MEAAENGKVSEDSKDTHSFFVILCVLAQLLKYEFEKYIRLGHIPPSYRAWLCLPL